jgi:hypothetical protein
MSTLVVTSLRHTSSSSNNVVLDSAGNVGIGTAAPGYLFTVNGQAALNQIILPGTTNYITAPAAGSTVVFQTVGLDRAAITSTGLFQFNSNYGSVATAFGCRAWVNFNGQGTVAIRGSGNISSITDNGVGQYRVNFASAMPDGNYSAVMGCDDGSWGNKSCIFSYNTTDVAMTTIRGDSNAVYDSFVVSVAIFR